MIRNFKEIEIYVADFLSKEVNNDNHFDIHLKNKLQEKLLEFSYHDLGLNNIDKEHFGFYIRFDYQSNDIIINPRNLYSFICLVGKECPDYNLVKDNYRPYISYIGKYYFDLKDNNYLFFEREN